MQPLSFANGDRMPALGLGTWKCDPGYAHAAVKEALAMGYRHIDCAKIYGNEAEVGQALAESFADGIVKREELWVTSKLWNDAHQAGDVRPALERTLADLRLDHLDLYLMHWPVAHRPDVVNPTSGADFLSLQEVPLAETWAALEDTVEAGLTRHVGVSNFSAPKLRALAKDARTPPAMNQVELHPYLQQTALLDACRELGIHVTAYSPLGSGDRPERMKTVGEPRLLADPTIVRIATRRNVTPAQVLLAWALARGTAAIPKSVNPGRMQQNLDAADVTLAPEDLAAIAELDRRRRYIDGRFWEKEGGPYTVAGLWDE